jgi:hypothetical protein
MQRIYLRTILWLLHSNNSQLNLSTKQCRKHCMRCMKLRWFHLRFKAPAQTLVLQHKFTLLRAMVTITKYPRQYHSSSTLLMISAISVTKDTNHIKTHLQSHPLNNVTPSSLRTFNFPPKFLNQVTMALITFTTGLLLNHQRRQIRSLTRATAIMVWLVGLRKTLMVPRVMLTLNNIKSRIIINLKS